MTTPTPGKRPSSRSRGVGLWHLLLLGPFVGALSVPFYDSVEPRLAGWPFFYWYQFLWIGIGALLTAVVYFATRDRSRDGDA